MKGSPITLTTDFGLIDEYVGVLKGVILSINPRAAIIDLSHGIPPQAIGRAAEVLAKNHCYFPDGSVHVCVVDPGVGTERRIIVVSGCNQLFIGPDNGVFSRILETDQAAEVYELTNDDWFLERISTTFQARDIMAPAAARLSLGASVEEAGPRIPTESCITIPEAKPLISETEIIGEISAIDRFGNLITNIEAVILFDSGLAPDLAIRIKSHLLLLHHGSYGHLPDNRPAAIINSSGVLEICVKNDSGAAILGVEIGERIVVSRK
jgi:S-adenosylmethionine hydrolase